MSLILKDISAQRLEAVLVQFGVPARKWSEINDAQTIEDLHAMLEKEDAELRIGATGIRLTMVVVQMLIQDHQGLLGYLLEERQITPEGMQLELNRPPAGHIKVGEDPETALCRELKEELGLNQDDYTIVPGMVRSRLSASSKFPGLQKETEFRQFWVRLKPNVKIENGFQRVDPTSGKTLTFRWAQTLPKF